MLNNTKIKNLKQSDKIYRVTDQHGLCIEIRPTGSKYWRYRFRFDGKATMMPLGQYPLIGLAEARELHNKARKLLDSGINPISHKKEMEQKKKAQRQDLFKHHAKDFIDKLRNKRSAGYVSAVKSNLTQHILPAIGDKSISDIDTIDIINMINNTHKKIKNKGRFTGEVTAELCRQQTGLIFRHAMRYTKGLHDPTTAAKGEVERPPIQHARDLTRPELKKLLINLENYGGIHSTKGVIWTMLYTIARTKEARFMRWEHVDLERKLWSIPLAEISRRRNGERNMKTDKPHMIPLCTQMIEMLTDMYAISGNREFVFPSSKHPTKPLGGTTVNRALEQMHMKDVTGHDTRATCSTYLHEMGYDTDHINFQMAHTDNTVSGIYNHAKWLPERKEMLQTWANYLDELKLS